MLKKISLICPILFIALIFSSHAFAQGGVQAGAQKIGFIDTGAFYDEKVGITRLVNAYKVLNTEISPKQKELETLGTRIQTLEKELTALQEQANKGVAIDRNAANSKSEEYEKAKREYQFKSEDLKAVVERRRPQVVGPVSQEIGKALDEFAKQKGFGVLMDVSKFQEAGALLFYSEAADSTKEFIAFFNARPATPAAAPKPATATKPN